jgi:YidC/Oxa1 family membrane protein insertase
MIGTIWNTVFYEPILNSLLFFYSLFGENLGFAIIMLTVILRAILFPFMKSQYESSMKLRELQPQLEKIKKKYDRNPKKAQEEQLKLYKKVGYNPLGCLFSSIIPLPFMFAIYQTIRNFSSGEAITGVYEFVANILGMNGNIVIDTNFFGLDLSLSYLPLAREHGYIAFWILPYLIIALLVGVSQYYSVKFNQGLMGVGQDKKKEEEKKKKDKKKKDGEHDMPDMMQDMGKSMQFTFPAMTSFIALSLPSAVSLYWILQSWVPVGMYQLYTKLKENRENGKK